MTVLFGNTFDLTKCLVGAPGGRLHILETQLRWQGGCLRSPAVNTYHHAPSQQTGLESFIISWFKDLLVKVEPKQVQPSYLLLQWHQSSWHASQVSAGSKMGLVTAQTNFKKQRSSLDSISAHVRPSYLLLSSGKCSYEHGKSSILFDSRTKWLFNIRPEWCQTQESVGIQRPYVVDSNTHKMPFKLTLMMWTLTLDPYTFSIRTLWKNIVDNTGTNGNVHEQFTQFSSDLTLQSRLRSKRHHKGKRNVLAEVQ